MRPYGSSSRPNALLFQTNVTYTHLLACDPFRYSQQYYKRVEPAGTYLYFVLQITSLVCSSQRNSCLIYHHQSFLPKETSLFAGKLLGCTPGENKQSTSGSLANDPRERPIEETLPQGHTLWASRVARHGLPNVSARYVLPQHVQDRGVLASMINFAQKE